MCSVTVGIPVGSPHKESYKGIPSPHSVTAWAGHPGRFVSCDSTNHQTNNFLELNYDEDLMILGIGEWCHDHPESVSDAIEIIERTIDDKIVIWKVTRPDGYWYSGFYDIDEWRENKDLVDEPDTGIEAGDKIEKATFSKTIEDRIVE
jgi:hypothetical protein